MNYQKHYTLLMDRAPKLSWLGEKRQAPSWKKRDGEYREGHRILAGCMGGKYTSNNVAYLTPEEHYVAHQLLVKIYPDNHKMVFALKRMLDKGPWQERRTNKRFGWVRRKLSETFSIQNKGKHFSPHTEFKKGQHPINEFKVGQKSITKGLRFANNGKENILHDPNTLLPKGFQYGMLKSGYTNNGKTGKHIRTKEMRLRMSESRRGKGTGLNNAMANPEVRRRHLEAIHKYHQSRVIIRDDQSVCQFV
jgi:hypothetical protein